MTTSLDRARTAIVHDWFQGLYGSERVVESIGRDVLSCSPTIYTFTSIPGRIPAELESLIVRRSRLASLPGLRARGDAQGHWRYLLPVMPRYFRSLDLAGYDLVVASSHACAVNASPPHGVPYVCYCHTPIRYAWLPELDRREVSALGGVGLRVFGGWLRKNDLSASRRPDAFIANSESVRARIRRFYGREAVVIHPPVDVDDFDENRTKVPGSFLWVQRLVHYKRPELVAEAFRGLPYRLTMVGTGPLEPELRRNLPPNVMLRGWVDRAELVRLYEEASGFIHVAEEDFGISVVEALAAGTPVLALRAGGGGEIVRDGIDGVLVDSADLESLRKGIRALAESRWDTDVLAARAENFSRQRFASRMRDHLNAVLTSHDRGGGTREGSPRGDVPRASSGG